MNVFFQPYRQIARKAQHSMIRSEASRWKNIEIIDLNITPGIRGEIFFFKLVLLL